MIKLKGSQYMSDTVYVYTKQQASVIQYERIYKLLLSLVSVNK